MLLFSLKKTLTKYELATGYCRLDIMLCRDVEYEIQYPKLESHARVRN